MTRAELWRSMTVGQCGLYECVVAWSYACIGYGHGADNTRQVHVEQVADADYYPLPTDYSWVEVGIDKDGYYRREHY